MKNAVIMRNAIVAATLLVFASAVPAQSEYGDESSALARELRNTGLPLEQAEAMSRSKVSLQTVTETALRTNGGYRTVSVTPGFKEGRLVAEIVIVNGNQWKTLSETLEREDWE